MTNDKKGNNKLPLIIGIVCLLLVAVVAITMALPSTDNNLDTTPIPPDNNTSVEVTPTSNNSDDNNSVEEAKSTAKYSGNSDSLKFHYPSCQWAKKISENNLIEFKSRQEAINTGYSSCKVCKP